MLRRGTLLVVALLCLIVVSGCSRSTAQPVAQQTAAAPTEAPPPTATPTTEPSPTLPPTETPTPTQTPTPLPPVRIVASYPIDGDKALAPDRPVVITFDRPMNPEAVANALTISPAVEGMVEWPAPDRMMIRPNTPWSEGDYTVTLAAGPLGNQGEPLEAPLTLRFSGGGRGVPVPILMYHAIEELGEDASASKRTWTVSPAAFAEQMAYLQAEGWTTVSPDQLARYLTTGEPLPPRPVIISMDDGYKEIHSVVYPLLKDTPLRPILYVPPDHVGLRAYLDWDQLRELVDAGFMLGTHGYDHTPMREAPDADLPRQVQGSKAFFEEALGVTIDSFCYPYGSYDQRTLDALSAYGYTSAMTLNPIVYQVPGEPLLLSRLLVHYDMTLEEFTELLP